MNSTENWRPVPGYPRYEVSDMGRVRKSTTLQLLRAQKHSAGYSAIAVTNELGAKTQLVHRLVASAFLERNQSLPWVHHKNADKKDNRLANLEWCTPKQNSQHMVAVGHQHRPNVSGILNGRAVLNEEKVRMIARAHRDGASIKAIARSHGVAAATVYLIVHRKTWAHITHD